MERAAALVVGTGETKEWVAMVATTEAKLGEAETGAADWVEAWADREAIYPCL